MDADHSSGERLHRPMERLVPNPKLKFMEQCREVMRFHRLALRTEEAYWQWIKRFMVFHRGKAEILKAENRNRKAEGNSEHPTAFTPWDCSPYSTGELEHPTSIEAGM
jgi:hypothetical protein